MKGMSSLAEVGLLGLHLTLSQLLKASSLDPFVRVWNSIWDWKYLNELININI